MFIPHLDERDNYDTNGTSLDDINTLAEYIDQVVLNNADDTPEDEDDDNAQNFSPDHTDYYLHPNLGIDLAPFPQILSTQFVIQPDGLMPHLCFDIIAPPPKA